MATQKPISSISYNTEAFLKEKLETWLKAHIIQSYMYIKHKGEDGDKDHIHFRIEPNKKLDPMDLMELLEEHLPGEKKPRGVRPFRPSKEEDWLLYAIHDKDYLMHKYGEFDKGEKIPYDWTDIIAPGNFDVETAFIRAKQSAKHTSSSLANRLKLGEKPIDLLAKGENPFMLNAIMKNLQENDYEELAQKNQFLRARMEAIEFELDRLGLTIVIDENGELKIEKALDDHP